MSSTGWSWLSGFLAGATASAAANLARADDLIGRALAASPLYALAHHVKGQVLRAQNRFILAIPGYETALAPNPNLVATLNGLGWCRLCTRSIDGDPARGARHPS
jgi:Tfp pilus assembly protein PilF